MCKCESGPSSTVHTSVILVTQKSRLVDVIFCEFQTIHENILFYFCHIQDITDWIQWQYKTCFIIINQHVFHNYHYYYHHHYDHRSLQFLQLHRPWHCAADHLRELWTHCSFLASIGTAHGDLDPGSTFEDPALVIHYSRRTSVKEQTTSDNPVIRLCRISRTK